MCLFSADPHPPTAVLTAGLRTLVDPAGLHRANPLKWWSCHPSALAAPSVGASDQEPQESARGGGKSTTGPSLCVMWPVERSQDKPSVTTAN